VNAALGCSFKENVIENCFVWVISKKKIYVNSVKKCPKTKDDRKFLSFLGQITEMSTCLSDKTEAQPRLNGMQNRFLRYLHKPEAPTMFSTCADLASTLMTYYPTYKDHSVAVVFPAVRLDRTAESNPPIVNYEVDFNNFINDFKFYGQKSNPQPKFSNCVRKKHQSQYRPL